MQWTLGIVPKFTLFQICYAMPLVSKMAISKGETEGKNLLLS